VAAEVTVEIYKTGQPSSDWLTIDANASYRLDSAATFGGSYSEVTTAALTTGTERYEVTDSSGTVGSTWYRFRIEDAADTALSDWTVPFQVLAKEPIVTLSSMKLALGAGATATDDDVLAFFVDGVNGAMVQRIGYYPGPSDDTTRTYHGKDAVRDRTRLWIPGGIRSLTSMTIAGATGDTATAIDTDDVILGPDQYALRPGEPYQFIEFKDVTNGDWSYFPRGYSNVIPVGEFGWVQPPADLVRPRRRQLPEQIRRARPGDPLQTMYQPIHR